MRLQLGDEHRRRGQLGYGEETTMVKEMLERVESELHDLAEWAKTADEIPIAELPAKLAAKHEEVLSAALGDVHEAIAEIERIASGAEEIIHGKPALAEAPAAEAEPPPAAAVTSDTAAAAESGDEAEADLEGAAAEEQPAAELAS